MIAGVRTRLLVASASLIVSIGTAACSERPAQCVSDGPAALEALEQDSAGSLAPRSIEAARDDVARAQAHIDEQVARFGVLRRWDAQLCDKGVAALAQARAEVSKARAARDEALALEQGARARLDEGERVLATLAAFLDGGVVGPDIAERIAQARGRVKATAGKLALTLGELRGAGFLGPLEATRATAAEADSAARQLAELANDAATQAVTRCRPRLNAKVPSFSGPPRVLGDWLAWRGVAGEQPALFVFRLDRARRTCRQLAARVDSAALPLPLDDNLRVWRAGGRVAAQLLAGFGVSSAWFVPQQGGGMFTFSHDRAARFVRACERKVSCGPPDVGLTTMEATCACDYQGLDIAISDRNRRVRYVWDGRAVRAEQ